MLSVKNIMITSRNDILQKAVETYKAVYEKAADRYANKLQYTIVDTVGYNCTLIEELFRPLWAIAPVISENDFKININGASVSICDFINKIMLDGTDSKNDRSFDKDVTEKNEWVFANQSITEFAAYMVTVAPGGEVIAKLDKPGTWQVVDIDMEKEVFTNTLVIPGRVENIRDYLHKCRNYKAFSSLAEEGTPPKEWDEIYRYNN